MEIIELDTSNDQDEYSEKTDTVSANTDSNSQLTSASKKAKCKRALLRIKRCIGYDAKIQNFYSRFPHHIQDFEKEKIKFVISNQKFHSLACANSDFNVTSEGIIDINPECENLKNNTYLRSLIERTIEIKDHTNYQYLSYEQLIKLIEKKNGQINDLKLENCNLKKNNTILVNSHSDLHKLMRLIASNDISRVNTMLHVLLKQGHGVYTILEKFAEAVNNVYHCKSFSKKEIDLGIFILRTGNPIFFEIN